MILARGVQIHQQNMVQTRSGAGIPNLLLSSVLLKNVPSRLALLKEIRAHRRFGQPNIMVLFATHEKQVKSGADIEARLATLIFIVRAIIEKMHVLRPSKGQIHRLHQIVEEKLDAAIVRYHMDADLAAFFLEQLKQVHR